MISFGLLTWIIVIGIVCNVACAVLGCFLVLRRMSMLGDAIAHGVLPGIAIGFLLSGSLNSWALLAGAVLFGLLTALLTQTIATFTRVPADASMGIVFTSLFAVGVVLISFVPAGVDLDPRCIFYGSIQQAALDKETILGMNMPRLMPSMLFSLVLTAGIVLCFWKELKISSFDPALATAMGLNATLLHYLLTAVVAVVTVTSFSAIGSVLVVAMLIVPAACGHLLSDRLSGMMLWSVAAAVLCSVLGAFLTPGRGNVPGTMVLAAGGLFLLAVLFAPRHGVLARLIRNARLSLRIIAEDILATLYRTEENPQSQPSPPLHVLLAASGVTGSLAVWSLRQRGEIALAGGELALTDAGRRRAESLVRAHRLWEAYLDQNFDLPRDHLHDPATRMEHFIGPDLQKELADELQQPGIDPHGRAIPPL